MEAFFYSISFNFFPSAAGGPLLTPNFLLKSFAGKLLSLTFAVPKVLTVRIICLGVPLRRHAITKKLLQWQKKSLDL
jgi:hypothetical protein